MAKSAIVLGVLREHYPQIDSPKNPWANLCSKLRDPEIGALRHCIPTTGKKKFHCMKVKTFHDFFHTIEALYEGLKEKHHQQQC